MKHCSHIQARHAEAGGGLGAVAAAGRSLSRSLRVRVLRGLSGICGEPSPRIL